MQSHRLARCDHRLMAWRCNIKRMAIGPTGSTSTVIEERILRTVIIAFRYRKTASQVQDFRRFTSSGQCVATAHQPEHCVQGRSQKFCSGVTFPSFPFLSPHPLISPPLLSSILIPFPPSRFPSLLSLSRRP